MSKGEAPKLSWERWGVCLRASTLTHEVIIFRDDKYKEKHRIHLYTKGCFEGVQGTCPRPMATLTCNSFNKCRAAAERLVRDTPLPSGLARIHAGEENSKIRDLHHTIERLKEDIGFCEDQIKDHKAKRKVYEEHAARSEELDKKQVAKIEECFERMDKIFEAQKQREENEQI